MRKPNIILLTVDSLRADRVGEPVRAASVMPEVDELFAASLRPEVSYTHCSSTIGAFPTLMTSTRPLSFGGFDLGAIGRPPTLAAHLAASGYRSTHFSTVHWVNSVFGYGDGSVTEEMLVHPATLAGAVARLLGLNIRRLLGGRSKSELAMSQCEALVGRYLIAMIDYWSKYRHDDLAAFRTSTLGRHHFRRTKLLRHFEREMREFRRDPQEYVRRAARDYAEKGTFSADRQWRLDRSFSDQLAMAGAAFASGATKPLSRQWSTRIRHRWKPYPDAETVVDRILGALQAGSGEPVFIWSHLFDAHTPFTSGSGDDWRRDISRWLKRAGHNETIDPTVAYLKAPRSTNEWVAWRALYDASLSFVSFHIGRLRRELDRRGLADTLIVVSSDHGEELGEHGDVSHRFRPYEHNVRIATFFNHPDVGPRVVPGFGSLLDVAPTVCGLADIEPHSGWEGQVLASETQGQRTIVFETFFGSPCDFAERPIYFAVREGPWKLHWTEFRDPKDPLGRAGASLFDLHSDPDEQTDVSAVHPDIVSRLMKLIRARQQELLLENHLSIRATPDSRDPVHDWACVAQPA